MKFEKSEFIISFILILNIFLITIPFSIKNHNLKQQIHKSIIMENDSKKESSKNPIASYENFNKALNTLNINHQDKKAYFSKDSLKVDIIIKNNIIDVINLIDTVNKDFSLISCQIEKDNVSTLCFEMIENEN